MKNYPEKRKSNQLQQGENRALTDNQPSSPFGSFVSFKYSSKTVYSDGRQTHIKAKENRFENGRFESEEFEGTLDNSVHEKMTDEIQQRFAKQMDFFFKPFSMFLPGPKGDDK